MDKADIAQSITPLWTPLNDEQRKSFIEALTVQRCDRNDILFKPGDPPDYCYYLVRGKVTISRQGTAGLQQIIRMVEPGALFGYTPAFDDSLRQSLAVASEGTVVAAIPMELVFRLIWENKDIAFVFIKELSYLLGVSVRRTMSMTQKHIRGRLAEILLVMKHKYGVERDGQTLAVYLSRQDLGQMANMTTSNAIRTLSCFAQEGLLVIEGRKIRFLDIPGLERISRLG